MEKNGERVKQYRKKTINLCAALTSYALVCHHLEHAFSCSQYTYNPYNSVSFLTFPPAMSAPFLQLSQRLESISSVSLSAVVLASSFVSLSVHYNGIQAYSGL